MTRKRLLITIFIVVDVIVLLALLPLFINVNRFRPTIESNLQQALGRPVSIGEMEFSWWAGGVRVNNIVIGEDPAFGRQPFLRAKSLDVGVQLGPLIFSRTLHVTGLTLQQPEVRLIRGAGSRWNFSSLGKAPAAGRSRGAHPALRQAAVTTDAAPGSSSLPNTLPNFSIDTLKVSDGKLLVGSTANPNKVETYDQVQLKASDISYETEMPFSLQARAPGGGELKAEGQAGPMNREDAAATPLVATVSLRNLDLAATGFIDPASGIAGLLDFDGKLQSDGRTAKTEGKVTAQKLKLVRNGSPARQPLALDYATEYDLQKQAGALTKGDILAGHSLAHLAGTYATRGAATVLAMKFTGSNMPVGDLEGLLPALGVVLPAGASLQGGTVSANLGIDGPLDHLVVTGPIDISGTRLAGYNLASKMQAIAALAGIKGGNETEIQTLSSNLRIAPEGIHADNLNLVLPALGSLTGSGTIGAGNSLDFRMMAKLANGGGVLGGLSALSTLGQSRGAIPFLIKGTTSAPVFLPDLGRAIGKSVTAPAQGVGSLLNGLFGHKTSH